jgi:hypothetical protein
MARRFDAMGRGFDKIIVTNLNALNVKYRRAGTQRPRVYFFIVNME